MGKSWENHEKIMGKSWESHLKMKVPMENQWDHLYIGDFPLPCLITKGKPINHEPTISETNNMLLISTT